MYQNSTLVGIPLNYSLFSSFQCIASCETSLAFHLHPKKETKNLWGWSTKSLIGGGNNFMTSMRRSSQDNFCGKNSQKSVKYSQSYDFVCQMALLGGKGLLIRYIYRASKLNNRPASQNSTRPQFKTQPFCQFGQCAKSRRCQQT